MARSSWGKWFGFETQLDRRERLRQHVRPRLERLEDRLAPATVPAGFEIHAVASGGVFASQHMSGLAVDPTTHNLYVATDGPNARSVTYGSFSLFRETPTGAVTQVGSYGIQHSELTDLTFGPDGNIYTVDTGNGRVYSINPNTGGLTLYSATGLSNLFRNQLFFDNSGNLIFYTETSSNGTFVFQRVIPGGGNQYLGSAPGADGDQAWLEPNGNYIIFGDSGVAPYEVLTAGHMAGNPYTTRPMSSGNASTLEGNVVGYSLGSIDPVTGDIYSAIGNFGTGTARILFTPGNVGPTAPMTVFVDQIGNNQLNSNAFGVTNLRFGSRTDSLPGRSLFFLDDYTGIVYEVRGTAPTISSFSPAVTEGGSAFTLTVNGANFDPSATVQWNGTPLTVTSRAGSTQIQATVPASFIAEEGSASITVTNPEMGATSAPGAFVVLEAPLSNVSNVAFSATEGVPFSGTVASFTDTDPGTAGDPTTNPADYTATITWGDGSTSPGTIAYAGTPGNFMVSGSHTYAEEGAQGSNFFVTIRHGTLADVSTPVVTVTVADAPLSSSDALVNPLAGTNTTNVARGVTWNSFFADPVTGKIYYMPGYDPSSGGTQALEYPDLTSFVNNTNARTISLPVSYEGTYHAALGGFLYYDQYNTNTLVKVKVSDGALITSAPLPGAGHTNQSHWNWGGYSDIDFYVDTGNVLYVLWAAPGGGNIQVSRLDPNSLAVQQTWTVPRAKTDSGFAVIVNGVVCIGNTFYSPQFNETYDLSSGTYNPSYTNQLTTLGGGDYITDLYWNPTTKQLFEQDNSHNLVYPNAAASFALTPPVATEGQAFSNVTVFHFSDADPAAAVTDYTAVITLGDGNTLTVNSGGVVGTPPAGAGGQVVANAGGGFDVRLSYTYAEELSNQTFSVQVYDNGNGRALTDPSDASTGASTSTFSVADAPLSSVANVAFSATEGAAFSGTVASFTDTDPGTAGDPTTNPADYTATITWGDGSTSAGTVAYAGTPGNFTVNASGAPHTYAEEGAQGSNFFVTIRHGSLADVSTPAVAVTVQDAALTAGSLTPPSVASGQAFSNVTVFHFTDADPNGTAGDYTAVVTRGDGTSVTLTSTASSNGQVVANAGGGFDVQLSYTYANPLSNKTFSVQVTDNGNGRTTTDPSDASTSASTSTFSVTEAPSLVVTTLADETDPYDGQTSLREAVAYANTRAGASTVSFQPGLTGTITLTGGVLTLSDTSGTMTIQGPGANLLTIDGNNSDRVFQVNSGVSAVLDSLTIAHGLTNGSGGGIYNAGTLTFSNSTLTSNVAYSGGGGMYNSGTATVSNSTLTNNSAPAFGGGAIWNASTLTVSNSTLASNSAYVGGGIDSFATLTVATLTVNNSTLASNSAGGVFNANGSTLNLANTILANSTSGTDLYNNGTVATAQNNLIQSQAGSPIQNGVNGNIVGKDPLLSALGNYGGPTQTFALLPGSPALDAGSNTAAGGLTTDQRGQARVADGTVDIGAFESRGFSVNLNSGGGQSTPINTAFTNPLAATVSSPYGEPITGGKVSFTAPASGASAALSASSVTLPASGQASVTATANGTAGSYAVAISAGGGWATSASLTNLKGTPTITWANPADITYGTALSATQLDATANVAGTFSYSPASGTVLAAGSGQTLSATFTPTDTADYNSASKSVTINVTPAVLTVTATGVNKVYDATTAATVTLSDNRVAGDALTVSYTTASFSDKNVGTGKAVSVSGISISGAAAGNYTLASTTAGATADITARPITVTAQANTKTYDGASSAAAAPAITAGSLAAGDTPSFTESYDNKNAGTGKTLTASGSVSDGNGGNDYAVTFVTSSTGEIDPRALTLTAAAADKTYDGTTASTATPTITSGSLAPGDSATLTEAFDSKNVGTRTLTPAAAVSDGNGGANYSVTLVTAGGTISTRAITVTATTDTRTYDATTGSTQTPTITSGSLAPGDSATLTEAFDNKNAGGRTLTATAVINDGNNGADYKVTLVSVSGTITRAPLTVTAVTNIKTYDGTNSAAATPVITAGTLFGSDTPGFFETYVTKNVGTGLTLKPFGAVNDGNVGTNYSMTYNSVDTGTITPRALTVSAAGVNKVYDGTTAATVTLSDNKVAGDSLTDSYSTATFADKNVGTGKAVSVSGISITGTDAGNYALQNTTASTTANVTARPLMVSAAGVNKVYDGTTTATVTLSDDRVSGDVLTDNYTTATFDTKNVGTGKVVSVSGISITGTDAGNYSANATAATTANITARPLTVTAAGINKVYDGTTAATVTLSDNKVAGDSVTDSYASASFDTKNVGTGKAVSVSGISITGTDAGNYSANTSASATADITARPLTVSAAGVNKVYDGGTTATVTLSDNRVAGDVLTDAYTSAAFADKSVGTAKGVSVGGISIGGTDAANYSLQNTTASTTANITARPLTVSAAGVNKVYDGTTAATVTLSDNKVAGDSVTDSYASASFDTKNVGTGKAVSVSGISLSGADATNYSLQNTTASSTANVTARPLTVTATGINRVYDGTASATVTLADNRVAGDIFTDGYTGATFGDKNVGAGKAVTVSGISITGTDAGNYTANTTASTTANITARPLTVSATGQNKVYDGGTTATVTLSDNRVTGDVLTDSYATATFADKNVGTAKTVLVSGVSISGTDSGNYSANTTASTTANITPRPLTASVVGTPTKAYDGTTAATLTSANYSLSNLVSGESFSVTRTAGTYDSAHVTTATTVSVSLAATDFTAGAGTSASNYSLPTTASGPGQITPYAFTYQVANDSQTFGTPANFATDLGTTINTGVNGEKLNIAYSSTGDTATATVGTYPITGTVSDGTGKLSDYSVTLKNGTLTVGAENTSVTVAAASVQYSDLVTLGATVSAGTLAGQALTGTVAFYINGSTTAAATAAVNATTAPVSVTATAASPILLAPGSYSVKAVFTSTNSNFNGSQATNATALTVTQEDARVTYTGALFASTSSATSSTATVTLSATVQDITAVTGDPAYDAYAGDVRNAKVTFVNRDVVDTTNPYGFKIIASNLAVGLVNSADTKTGTATYNWSATISGNSQQFTIGAIVSNYYTRNSSADDTVVTVSQPLSQFITGGGYLTLTRSSGLKAGDSGSKANFGFNVKFNNSGTNLQGNINVIVRRTEADGTLHVYQIKGNSMTSLSTQGNGTSTSPGKATFNGKANIQDITNPNNVLSVDGNATLQVDMTDNGDPGSSDTIGITVWNKSGGMWFSSNWSGTATVQQALAGGNLVVHSNGQVAGGPARGPGSTQVLTAAMLDPIVQEAIRRWALAGADPRALEALEQVQFRVTDLPDGNLGWAANRVIMLDVNGAGYGYFIDPTPGDDSEFAPGRAGPAEGRVDLLTLVMHEMGHFLGVNEVAGRPGDVMGEYIPVGVRELPTAQDLAGLGGHPVSPTNPPGQPVVEEVSAGGGSGKVTASQVNPFGVRVVDVAAPARAVRADSALDRDVLDALLAWSASHSGNQPALTTAGGLAPVGIQPPAAVPTGNEYPLTPGTDYQARAVHALSHEALDLLFGNFDDLGLDRPLDR